MKISILIPCFNELNTIAKIIESVRNSEIKNKEIIIVDDYSSDGTREFLKDNYTISNISDIKVFFHDKNQGKGASIRTAIKKSTGDILIIQDADLEYNPLEYPKLLSPILNGKADVVFGSRFIGGEERNVLYFNHRIINGFLTLLSNIFTNLTLTDMETCYKVFRSDVIKSITIEENRFGFEPEITAKISKLKIRIYEVGISYSGRTYEEGKKITWLDGIRAVYCIIKYNLFR